MGFPARLPVRIVVVLLVITTTWLVIRKYNSIAQQSVEVTGDEDESMNMKDDFQKVLITVYYEALCPDSKSFVLRQLEPTYRKLKHRVVISLIPYGKAETNEEPSGPTFTCQHGPLECEANMIHACAIDVLAYPRVSLDYIACMISHNLQPVTIAQSCGEKLGIDSEPILQCAKSSRGPTLLKKYGRMTSLLYPRLEFVPTITLDFDRENSDQIALLRDLLGEVCKKFKKKPAECT